MHKITVLAFRKAKYAGSLKGWFDFVDHVSGQGYRNWHLYEYKHLGGHFITSKQTEYGDDKTLDHVYVADDEVGREWRAVVLALALAEIGIEAKEDKGWLELTMTEEEQRKYMAKIMSCEETI